MKDFCSTITLCVVLFTLCIINFASATFVKPQPFLDSRLAKGFWIAKQDVQFAHSLFEGGWVWTASGNLQVTHVCRAKAGEAFDDISIKPGELLNETCYISGSPSVASLSGVRAFKQYEVLIKAEDEVFEWVEFERDEGTVPNGAIIGGIGSHYEPILICRKFVHGTAGEIRKSKAVLGEFMPKDGKCFYEMDIGTDWIKWDVSFATEKFQLLVLRVRQLFKDRRSNCQNYFNISI